MKFGAIDPAQAEGCILAHSLQTNAGRLPKGTTLTRADIQLLQRENHQLVTVARLEPGDLAEDQAATYLAQMLVTDPRAQGITLSGAGAGRVNLYAAQPGIVALQTDQIEALNQIDPMITLATVPPFHRVDRGGMIATIKIISYAVQERLFAQVKPRAASLQVLAARFSSADLIETRIGNRRPADKGRRALAGRLDRFEVALGARQVVPHDEQALANAMAAAQADVIFVLTDSATADPMDVAPAALRLAGGTVTRFGMPVDPGNLLFYGQLKDKPVIGLPGCARSPALNGADWVLERILCGVPPSSRDIAMMGIGGLLKEIPTRPKPRDLPVQGEIPQE